MSSVGSLTLCIHHLRSPDCRERNEAARVIWERFSTRLQSLVRRHLDNRIRRREDEQDILQSMYVSFCAGQLEGRLSRQGARSSGSSWCGSPCARSSIRPIGTRRRGATTAASVPTRISPLRPNRFSHAGCSNTSTELQPSPDEKLIVIEELQRLLHGLPEDLRSIVLWKLEGFTNAEIACMIGRTVRCIELKMQLIRKRLERGAEETERVRCGLTSIVDGVGRVS